jgi:ABC-2 type transport system permease protein
MTTTIDRRPVVAPEGPHHRTGSRPFAGTGTLVRFILRRDRLRVPAWLATITLVQVAGAASYPDLYPTAADRQQQATVIDSNPAMRALTGPGHGLADYTYGAMIANEFLSFVAIFVALMSVLLLVRHTRTEEETGRAELVRAGTVGRYAHLTAALVAVALTNVALGGLIAVGLAGLGIETVDWPGSVAFGAAFASVGLVFAGVAAVTVQLTAHARAAAGMAGALIGLAYLLRAIGDVGDGTLSWLSPIGWAQAAAPYVHNNPAPLLLGLGAAAGLVAAAFVLADRRDVGAGLRAGRTGAPAASGWLGTPLGFAWRLQRAGALWWGLAMLTAGVVYGSSVEVLDSYADNEVVRQIVEGVGGATLTESWLSMIVALLAVVCTVFAVIAVLRPRREETSGRGEALLATGLSRARLLGTHVAIGMVGGTLLLLVTGLGLGGAGALVSGDGRLVGEVAGAALAHAPALWVAAGFAVAAFGVLPRVTGLAWALLGYAAVVIYLGGLLDLPDPMRNLSPYTHVPRMPAEEFRVLPLLILAGVAALLTAVGWYGFRRRDLELA